MKTRPASAPRWLAPSAFSARSSPCSPISSRPGSRVKTRRWLGGLNGGRARSMRSATSGPTIGDGLALSSPVSTRSSAQSSSPSGGPSLSGRSGLSARPTASDRGRSRRSSSHGSPMPLKPAGLAHIRRRRRPLASCQSRFHAWTLGFSRACNLVRRRSGAHPARFRESRPGRSDHSAPQRSDRASFSEGTTGVTPVAPEQGLGGRDVGNADIRLSGFALPRLSGSRGRGLRRFP